MWENGQYSAQCTLANCGQSVSGIIFTTVNPRAWEGSDNGDPDHGVQLRPKLYHAFNCRIFPFHFEKHLFRTASWCPVGQQLSEIPTTQQKIQQITEEYSEYCIRFQNEYARAMQDIKAHFDLQVVHYK